MCWRKRLSRGVTIPSIPLNSGTIPLRVLGGEDRSLIEVPQFYSQKRVLDPSSGSSANHRVHDYFRLSVIAQGPDFVADSRLFVNDRRLSPNAPRFFRDRS